MQSTRTRADAAPGDRAFLFVGDHPALDLLNTVVGQGDARRDLLRDVASLRAWVAQVPWEWPEAKPRLLALGPEKAWRVALGEVHDVRELGRRIVAAWPAGPLPQPLLNELRQWMQQVPYDRDLREVDGELRQCWVPRLEGPRALAGLLAASFGDLLAGARAASVKSCAGSGCALSFLDRTKGQRRLFCSAALCGNRTKVAAYRARQREAGGDEAAVAAATRATR